MPDNFTRQGKMLALNGLKYILFILLLFISFALKYKI
jgi:hypothetical protein